MLFQMETWYKHLIYQKCFSLSLSQKDSYVIQLWNTAFLSNSSLAPTRGCPVAVLWSFTDYWSSMITSSAWFVLFQCIWDMGSSFSADLKHLLLIISVLGREMGSLLNFEFKFVLSLEDWTSSGFRFFSLLPMMGLLQTQHTNKL